MLKPKRLFYHYREHFIVPLLLDIVFGWVQKPQDEDIED
jgi:hypothetical protein